MDKALKNDQLEFKGHKAADREHRHALLKHVSEIISAFLLSFATVASAWCAYQSSRWNGVQTITFFDANNARSESIRKSNEALQLATIDVGMFTEFVAAYTEGNQQMMDIIMHRFRPEMKPAVEAWLATDPFNNPDAPPSPFAMGEYKSASQLESDRLLTVSERKFQEAKQANQTSDNYVLLTVVFASVLFFCGISTNFERLPIRVALIVFAIIIYVIAFNILRIYPIH